MSLSITDFDAFFEAVHGAGTAPFEWQRRLLDHVVREGRWPDVIAAPTGAGKTAVIDIHFFTQALCAADVPVRPPRRLSLVVDRRVLVDDQYDHACRIQDLLAKAAPSTVLHQVAGALTALATVDQQRPGPSLLVTRLRGGQPAPRRWRDDPLACQVICATPDMWGSRLLMGGYGSSTLARPREAGLLAYDSVVVVDEAHLSRQLLHTARRVAELAEVADTPIGVAPLQVVEATATPDDASSDQTVVGVTAVDLVDSEALRKRLCRPKPVELLTVPSLPLKGAAIQAFTDRAVELRGAFGPTVGCFVNNVSTAIETAKRLGEHGTAKLVCGRMRPYDLARLREENPGLLTVEGDSSVDFLVSTQSLEVGADLDWSAAVIELAPGSALAQRAGRVNRRGLHDATRIVVAVPDKLDAKTNVPPYAGQDLLQARDWIHQRAADSQGLAPWALRENRPPSQARRRTLLQRPELSDAWLWSRTSDELFATPDLDLWLADDLASDTDVGIVVRQDLPDNPEDALELIRLLPPRSHEAIPASIRLARERLQDVAVLAKPIVAVRDQEPAIYTDDRSVRPGDVIVVTSDAAIFSQVDGAPVLDTSGGQTASDVLEVDDPVPGEYVFRFDTIDLRHSYVRTLASKAAETAAAMGLKERQSSLGRAAIAERLQELAPELEADGRARVEDAIKKLTKARIKDFAVDTVDDEPPKLIITDNRRLAGDEEIRQQWTPAQQVRLDTHANAVAARASSIADRAGLIRLAELFELAGRHHDDGKADPRFQLSLDPDRDGNSPDLAKSKMTSRNEIQKARAESGLPGNWRHEQLSVLACWNDLTENKPPEGRDLIARLVGTSHGYGRPGFPHVTAGLLGNGKDHHDLAVTLFDEGMWDRLIERTHAAYGVWGCAYLEAVLRAADGQVSGEGS